MEQFILIMLGFALGLFTQYNYQLWQWMISALCLGFYKLVKSPGNNERIAELNLAGSTPICAQFNKGYMLSAIGVLSLEKILEDSMRDESETTLEKGDYTAHITFKLDLRKASV